MLFEILKLLEWGFNQHTNAESSPAFIGYTVGYNCQKYLFFLFFYIFGNLVIFDFKMLVFFSVITNITNDKSKVNHAAIWLNRWATANFLYVHKA